LFCFSVSQLKAQPEPVDLLCVSITPDNFNQLVWALPPTLCGGTFTSYDIYSSEVESGPYNLLTSITDESEMFYIDMTVSGNNNTQFYYIFTNCSGTTSTPTDTLDDIRPEAPVIDFVTVTGTDVTLKWEPSTSPETVEYIIYRYEGGLNPQIIDTVVGINTTIYVDNNNSEPYLQSERYALAARDYCGTTGAFTTADFQHATVYLEAQNDSCSNVVQLNWNDYINWPAGVDTYQLFVSEDGGPFSFANNLGGNTTSFNFLNTSALNDLCFEIKAIRNGDLIQSTSNQTCIELEIPKPPEYIYIKNATVVSEGLINIEYYIDPTAGLNAFRYWNGQDPTALSVFQTNLPPNPIPNLISVDHGAVNTNTSEYYYQVTAVDSCSNDYNSGIARTVFLKAKPEAGFNNYLAWSPFEIEYGVVSSYNIYRLDEMGNFNLLTTVSGSELEYTDFIGQGFVNPAAGICYKVEANFDLTPPLLSSESLSSFSNEVCIAQPALIYVPNAFAPNGFNNEFKAVLVNADEDNFLMMVMNRWGEVLYETNNPTDGWDGRIGGRVAQEGVYAYYFKYANINGVEKEKKGTVLLLR